MTAPLTPGRLAEIRGRLDRARSRGFGKTRPTSGYGDKVPNYSPPSWHDVTDLLAEVDRLRALDKDKAAVKRAADAFMLEWRGQDSDKNIRRYMRAALRAALASGEQVQSSNATSTRQAEQSGEYLEWLDTHPPLASGNEEKRGSSTSS